jgi:hypothetical protein
LPDRRRAREVLDDGTGRVRPDLQPLIRVLADDFPTGTGLASSCICSSSVQ